MKGRSWFALIGVIAVVAGVAYAAFTAYRSSQTEECYACQRAIHAHSRTVAIANGRSRVFCCPACALSEHEQEGKPIRITGLTDLITGAKLSPGQAFVVKGSDVNLCMRAHEMINADKQQVDVSYDRCSPSLLAFGGQSEAMQFAREHGGEVLPFSQVASAFTR